AAYLVISEYMGWMFGWGAHFSYSSVAPFDSSCYQYSCQVSNGRDRSGDASLRLLLNEKRLLQQIFLNPQNSYSLGRRTFKFIIRPLASILDQVCFIFGQLSEIVSERSEHSTYEDWPVRTRRLGCSQNQL